MMIGSQSKNIQDDGTKDLISDLPDCILSDILSRLPTKDAVQTSVLSKAWEYKWTSIHKVEVDHHISSRRISRSEMVPFIDFMNRIFLLSHNVTSFNLHFNEEYGLSYIERWISSVFRQNVQSVSLVIRSSLGGIEWYTNGIFLPHSLLDCTSLRELKLEMLCTLRVANDIHFPCLTSLFLSDVRILNDNYFSDVMTFTFPVLEELEITSCLWSDAYFVDIFAPALRTFAYETIFNELDDNCRIRIYGASLTRFETRGWFPENIVFVESTVGYADINVYSSNQLKRGGFGIRRLMKEFSGLLKLELSGSAAQALAVTKPEPSLLKYDTLREMTLSDSPPWADVANIEAIFELLHTAPFLNVLAINMDSVCFVNSQNGYDYDAMEFVPSCIASRLTIIRFINFENTTPQLQLAMFLLKNATCLKEFSISTVTGEGTEQIRRHLSECLESSSSLEDVLII